MAGLEEEGEREKEKGTYGEAIRGEEGKRELEWLRDLWSGRVTRGGSKSG